MTRFAYSSWLKSRVIPIIGVLLLSFSLTKHQGKEIERVIWSDMEGYYLYLPAVFINDGFKGLKCRNGCTIPNKELGWVHSKYTYGVAAMQAPFFFMAHTVAKYTVYESDGYSKPYSYSILFAGLFYFLAGLYILRKFLSARFSDWTVIVVLLIIGLGTNAYYYSTVGAGMSHVYSFFLFSSVLHLTEKWRDAKSLWLAIPLALVSGLIVLVRPTGVLMLLWIPFSGIEGWSSVWERVKLTFSSGLFILLPLLTALLYFPQFYYWKAFSGSWFTYSYGNEGFTYWASPKIIEVLFSHQNGLFMYSPLVLLGVFGLFPMWRANRTSTILTMVIMSLATYSFASWWAWWFGGAFGHRTFVEYFSLLSLPIAYSVQWIGTKGTAIKAIAASVCLTLLYANARMISHYRPPWDGPDWTWERYWKIWEWIF